MWAGWARVCCQVPAGGVAVETLVLGKGVQAVKDRFGNFMTENIIQLDLLIATAAV